MKLLRMVNLGSTSTDFKGCSLLIIGVEARTAESNPCSNLELYEGLVIIAIHPVGFKLCDSRTDLTERDKDPLSSLSAEASLKFITPSLPTS